MSVLWIRPLYPASAHRACRVVIWSCDDFLGLLEPGNSAPRRRYTERGWVTEKRLDHFFSFILTWFRIPIYRIGIRGLLSTHGQEPRRPRPLPRRPRNHDPQIPPPQAHARLRTGQAHQTGLR